MSRLYMSDEVRGRIHAHLTQVIKLPWLAWLYRHPCIPISSGVMGVIRDKPGPDKIAVFIQAVFIATAARHAFVGFFFPVVVPLHFFMLLGGHSIVVILAIIIITIALSFINIFFS